MKMDKQIIKSTGKYRVISICERKIVEQNGLLYIKYYYIYKVQVKVLCFWITVKEFVEDLFTNAEDFFENEAIELFDKLTEDYDNMKSIY